MRRHLPTLYSHPEDALDEEMEHEQDRWEMGTQQSTSSSRSNSSYYPARGIPPRINSRKGSTPSAKTSSTAYSHFVKVYRSQEADNPLHDPDSHYFQRGLGQLMDAGDSDDEATSIFDTVDIFTLAHESELSHPESRGEREQWRAMLSSVLSGDVLKMEKSRISNVLESASSVKEQLVKDIWIGIRARLHGTSVKEVKRSLDDQRIRIADTVIENVLKFSLTPDTPFPEAMDQVSTLLHRLDFVQSLYPDLKAFAVDKPVCREPQFLLRRDALITWWNINTTTSLQLARLRRWTGSETLDVNQRNTSTEVPIGHQRLFASPRGGPTDKADTSSFVERVLKEETAQTMFERRFLVTTYSFFLGAREAQIALGPIFKQMNLPCLEQQLVPLISFPTKLVQAGLQVRLDSTNSLDGMQSMIVDQMTEDLKLSIGLACLVKRQYQTVFEPDPSGNWNLPKCISDDYDDTIRQSIKGLFKLIHLKLRSGAKGIYFKETEILEAQRDTFWDVSLSVARGSCLIAEELCSTTNKLMVRVTNYFDTQMQVPHKHVTQDTHHGRRSKAITASGDNEPMTPEKMMDWYGKILESVRLRYRKLQRYARELINQFSNAAEYSLEGVRMDLFIRSLVETGHFLVYTRTYEEDSMYIVASHLLRDRPEAVTRILTEAFNVEEVINEDGSRAIGTKVHLASEEDDEPQYVLVLSPSKDFFWNGLTIELTDIPKIPLDPKDDHVRLIADGPHPRLALAKELFMDTFVLEDENGELIEPEITLKCVQEQMANIPTVNRELRKIGRATTRLAESIINSVHYVRNALGICAGSQELLENWYSFAAERGQQAQKFMERSSIVRFDRALIKHAISWVAFICDDCDPTDRKTFKWAVNALEFTFGRIKRNIQQLPEDQFQMLRHKVAKCMTLLIHHFDILGARSTTEASREKERQTAIIKAQASETEVSEVTYDAVAPTCDFWRNVSEAVAELESSRAEAISLTNHQTFGRVLDNSKLEDRTLVFLASASSNISIRWQLIKFVGAGAFGSVYSAMNLDNMTVIAVKEIKFQELSNLPNMYAQIKDELSVMELLHHQNIVEYYGIEVHRDKVYIFEELCQGGSLASLLEHGRIEDESIIQIYTIQMLDGLAYLHAQGIVHRDIKPDNILLDHRGLIKFADFGAAKILAKNQRTFQRSRRPEPTPAEPGAATGLTGTPMYMSPEVIKNERRGRYGAMDIWSLGCVVLECATGKKPWSNLDNEWAIMFHIGVATQHPPLPEPDELSSLGVQFLKRCLTIDPAIRPSAEELQDDLWLSSFRQSWEVPAEEDTSVLQEEEAEALLESAPLTPTEE
ncbi:unnamed protein product [Mycena citricolor]|uniref:Protein kinase domain-containing protein n=1 Tax=Mycena citricolor TaxID=2018698 RepID=A0AAD2HPU3_9AGAR|nr:unnamed protein product [Mycena citricolor]